MWRVSQIGTSVRRLAENAKPGGLESDLAPTNNLRRDLTFFFMFLWPVYVAQ